MKKLLFILFNIFTVSTFISCDKEEAVVTPPAKEVSLATSATLGKILSDKDGKTLYFFSSDVAGGSQCTGACLTNWPVFYKEAAALTLSTDLAAADFASITRSDGAMQTTYKGWPLYYYAKDTSPGMTTGENVGKIWFVAKTTYNLFVGNAQLVGNDGKKYKSDYTEGEGKTQYLMDDKGRTIYAFANDKKNTNVYTKADFSNDGTWPIVQIADFTNIPSGFVPADFSVIDVFGKKQLTFRGRPLYYFGSDNSTKGLTKGISVPKAGVWPIVNADTTPL